MYNSTITASEYKTIVYVGGENESQLAVAESYNTMDGTSFKQLTSIPEETLLQCLVIVNKTMLFMAGGRKDEGLTSISYVYSKSR
jgi:hypothetical protein